MHRDRCFCELIPRLSLKTRVCLVIHCNELKRPTNTGRLATKALVNSEMRIRGEDRERLDLSDLLTPNYRTLLFYPAPDAIELTPDFVRQSTQPIQLILPDGNWRQASKVHYRHHELRDVPRVMIKEPNKATRHLRRESTPEGMATLQALACAMKIIEGDDAGDRLMALYQTKLERTLSGRPFEGEVR